MASSCFFKYHRFQFDQSKASSNSLGGRSQEHPAGRQEVSKLHLALHQRSCQNTSINEIKMREK